MMTDSPLELLTKFKWFSGPISHSVASVFDGINRKVEGLDLLRKYRRAHFESIEANLNSIKLLGMPQARQLTDVYWPARVSTTIASRLYRDNWVLIRDDYATITQDSGIEGDVVDATRFVEENSRIVILGGPGSGKTTFLKYLTLAYANEELFSNSQLESSKFPIYVHLPAFARSGKSTLIDYVTHSLATKSDQYAAEFLRRVMKGGAAAILLDSLDEVPEASSQHVLDAVNEACDQYPTGKYVLACRTADYKGQLSTFSDAELASLTDEAVVRIVRSWFDDQHRASDLIAKLERESDIRTFVHNPLLLALLCVQFRHDLALPKRKVELFRRCSDALLRDWDASRNFRRESAYENLSDDKKERLFETIAAHGYRENDASYIFLQRDVVKWIGSLGPRLGFKDADAEGILSEIERHHGILERFSADAYAFSHPSFQEYFAARYFVSDRAEVATAKERCYDEPWRNIIEYMAGIMADPDPMIEVLIQKSQLNGIQNYPAMGRRVDLLHLLYRCIVVGASMSGEVRNRAVQHIVESHYEIARIYGDTEVFPFPKVREDGVYHIFFHMGKQRKTLGTALQSLHRLSNEIFANPNDVYAVRAVQAARGLLNEIIDTKVDVAYFRKLSIMSWIMMPVASSNRDDVAQMVVALSESLGHGGSRRGILRSVLAGSADYLGVTFD